MHSDMISTARNRMLLDMAEMVRRDPRIGETLQKNRVPNCRIDL
jgi:hypothetical protein